METLCLRREFRLHVPGHEIEAQDRADHAERIGDRIADRRLAVFRRLQRRLKRCGAGHRSGENAERMPDLDSVRLTQCQRHNQPGNDANSCNEVGLQAGGAGHAFEKLASVENADPVKEHDQTGEADRPDYAGLRRERTDRQSDEQDSPDPERKSPKVDLADQVPDANREEHGKDRLAPEDVTSKVQHKTSPIGNRRGVGYPISVRCSRQHGTGRSHAW